MTKKLRIRFLTVDGSLIMDRKTDGYWFDDLEFLMNVVLKRDACERGVRMLGCKHYSSGVDVTVEYL